MYCRIEFTSYRVSPPTWCQNEVIPEQAIPVLFPSPELGTEDIIQNLLVCDPKDVVLASSGPI